MTIILKDNSKEIRKKIQESGISVCICARFKDACWLDYHTNVTDSVHGVGFWDDDNGTTSQQEELDRFIAECQDPYYCENVDEFIKKIKEVR